MNDIKESLSAVFSMFADQSAEELAAAIAAVFVCYGISKKEGAAIMQETQRLLKAHKRRAQ